MGDKIFALFHFNSNCAPGPSECYVGQFDIEGVKEYFQREWRPSNYNNTIDVYAPGRDGNLTSIASIGDDYYENGKPTWFYRWNIPEEYRGIFDASDQTPISEKIPHQFTRGDHIEIIGVSSSPGSHRGTITAVYAESGGGWHIEFKCDHCVAVHSWVSWIDGGEVRLIE